jgi:cytoskeleton protein RodZ
MASFGERLKKEREQKGISLEDISLETKIGTRLLRALEEEHFDQLPGGIFNKGFVRAYARHLGLDEEQTIADYMAATGAPPPVVEEVFPIQVPQRDTPVERALRSARIEPPKEIPWGVLAVLLLVVALGFASWTYFHRPGESKHEAAPVASQPAPTSNPAGDTRNPDPEKPSQTAAPATPAESGRPISSIPTTVPASANAAPVSQATLHGTSSSPVINAAAGMFSVRVKGNDDSEDCWISVSVDGQPPVEATLIAPYERVVEAKNEAVVKVGNAGAVDVFFNGKPLPRLGEYGVVRTLIFHPDGLQPPAPASAPKTATPLQR